MRAHIDWEQRQGVYEMAYETHSRHSSGSISLTDEWIAEITSWLRARREKISRNREIRNLLSYDERLLEDAGLSRPELVWELGCDPRELPGLFGAALYLFPHR